MAGLERPDETAVDPALWDALAQRDGEHDRAHAAFLDYFYLGPGRSLQKLCVRYRAQSESKAGAKPPTRRKATLDEWSARYEWQARLKAFKDEFDRREQERWIERQRQVREADWAAGIGLRDLAAQILTQSPQFMKTTRKLVKGRNGDPDTVVITVGLETQIALKALELASDLQRKAAEILPPVQQHQITTTVNFSADDLAQARDKVEQLELALLDGHDDGHAPGDSDDTGD